MPRSRIDYLPLKKAYITSDISIRKLAEQHEISWSTLNARKNKEGWDNQRDEFRKKRDERTVERLAERAATESDVIRDEMILVLRAAIRKFGADLATGNVTISAGDLTKLVTTINLLLGEPTTRTEAQVFGVALSSQVDPDILRRVVELARTRSRPTDGPRTPGVGPEEPLTN